LRESQQPIRETIFRGEDGLRFVIGLVMHACVHPKRRRAGDRRAR
jgi:hypothetical protein